MLRSPCSIPQCCVQISTTFRQYSSHSSVEPRKSIWATIYWAVFDMVNLCFAASNPYPPYGDINQHALQIIQIHRNGTAGSMYQARKIDLQILIRTLSPKILHAQLLDRCQRSAHVDLPALQRTVDLLWSMILCQ